MHIVFDEKVSFDNFLKREMKCIEPNMICKYSFYLLSIFAS